MRIGVADELIGNFAVAEANSKRAIRMPVFYSKRLCAIPTLKNSLRLQKQRQTCEMIPFARTTVSTSWVASAWWRLRCLKSNARHGHFGRIFFFFLHAYTTSDLRICTQRMFARNISDYVSGFWPTMTINSGHATYVFNQHTVKPVQIKRPPVGATESGLYRQVISIRRFHALMQNVIHWLSKGVAGRKSTQRS